VIQGGSLGGLGCWSGDVCHSIFIQSLSFRLLFLRVDCKNNRLSFLVTVFDGERAFNRDLNQWDVAEVTRMPFSKSIRILENDVT
jgi:hypothetical protein